MRRTVLTSLLLVLLVGGCDTSRVQIFSLIGVPDESPGGQNAASTGGNQKAVQDVSQDGGKLDVSAKDSAVPQIMDAGMKAVMDAASDSEPCPSGSFEGMYSCMYPATLGGTPILVLGTMKFVVGREDINTGTAPIVSGSVNGFLPRAENDPTPIAQFPTVDLHGLVRCGGGRPQLEAKTGQVPITSVPELVSALLAPQPVQAEIRGPLDDSGSTFDAVCTVYGPPNCVGTATIVASSP